MVAVVCAVLAVIIFTTQHKLAVTYDTTKAQNILSQMIQFSTLPGYEPKYAFDFVPTAGIKVKMVSILPKSVDLPKTAPRSVQYTAFEVLAMPSIKDKPDFFGVYKPHREKHALPCPSADTTGVTVPLNVGTTTLNAKKTEWATGPERLLRYEVFVNDALLVIGVGSADRFDHAAFNALLGSVDPQMAVKWH